MGVVNTKATLIGNADSVPPTLTNSHMNGYLREMPGTVEVAAADSDGSVYRLVRVPSNCRVSELTLANDAITAGTSFDVGIYKTARDGGAVVSAALFASAVDLSSAHDFTNDLLEATATDISQCEKRLWELAGLSADPGIDYDICATGNTVGSAAGTISMKVKFVV
jgi:hypothetical protein